MDASPEPFEVSLRTDNLIADIICNSCRDMLGDVPNDENTTAAAAQLYEKHKPQCDQGKSKLLPIHEAAHAVLAVASTFHSLAPGEIDVRHGDYGVAPVSLSRSKVGKTGRDTSDPYKVEKDPDVAADMVVVLLAGLAAERRYCRKRPNLQPDESLCRNDYNDAINHMDNAGIPREQLAAFEGIAATLVEKHWKIICAVAGMALDRGVLDNGVALDFITNQLNSQASEGP